MQTYRGNIVKIIRKLFRIKWYTGHDCHHCGREISENWNQATVFNGRLTLKTVCKPCYAVHLEIVNK